MDVFNWEQFEESSEPLNDNIDNKIYVDDRDEGYLDEESNNNNGVDIDGYIDDIIDDDEEEYVDYLNIDTEEYNEDDYYDNIHNCFDKNYQLKIKICEKAEALAGMEDVIAAVKLLQLLHQEFREIGPVAKDLREDIWNRFKAASTLVNRRHQKFFEARKEQEYDNLARKTAICEQIEAINIDELKTFADWNQKTDEIIALQQEWKTIGFAPQKMNVKIFERLRAACDKFFNSKSEFIKSVHESLNANYQLKLELCEQAEALKDSTDWKKTTDAIIALQKKWKEIGTVPKKYSDEIWERFNVACDAFFAAKKEANSIVYSEQEENLKKKQAIINRLATIDPDTEEEDFRPKLRQAQEEWNKIGFVPFKHKETIYKAFRVQMDRLYGAYNNIAAKKRINKFKECVNDSNGKVMKKLIRKRDNLNNEIKKINNNLNNITTQSNQEDSDALINPIKRKLEKLHKELEEVKEKISVLKEKE